jgi:ectoine hydroxylase-related dioxygenase (phytanoyl-CoA dioxygenase family)
MAITVIRGLLSQERCDELIACGALLVEEPLPNRVPMPHRLRPEFLDAMREPAIVALARGVIGPCDGLGSDYFYHPPGAPGLAVHTDNDYVEAPEGAFVSIWIALVDVTPENGCLYSDADIPLEKGDAVLIGQSVPHGSHQNRTGACRNALLLTYLAHGADFRPGKTQNRTRVPLC